MFKSNLRNTAPHTELLGRQLPNSSHDELRDVQLVNSVPSIGEETEFPDRLFCSLCSVADDE